MTDHLDYHWIRRTLVTVVVIGGMLTSVTVPHLTRPQEKAQSADDKKLEAKDNKKPEFKDDKKP